MRGDPLEDTKASSPCKGMPLEGKVIVPRRDSWVSVTYRSAECADLGAARAQGRTAEPLTD